MLFERCFWNIIHGKRHMQLMISGSTSCSTSRQREVPIKVRDSVRKHLWLTSKDRPVNNLLLKKIMFNSMSSTTENDSVNSRNFEVQQQTIIINDSQIEKFTTEDVCRDLASYPNQKIEVEKLSNNYLVAHNLIQTLPACIVIVFISTWSDIYGRKVPLVIIIVGLALEGLSIAICAAFFKNSIWLILVTAAFTGLSGGLSSATSIAYSYVSDISTTSQRTLKYALMDLVSGISYTLGQLSGGWLYTYSGYVPAMVLSASGNLLALVTVVFVLKETRGLENADKWPAKLKSLFSCKSVIEGIKATVESRPNRGRTKMFLLILGLTMTTLSYSTTSDINFLYVNYQYNWDNTQYTTVSSPFSILGLFLMFIAVPVFKHFNLEDVSLGITGNASLIAQNIITGFAIHPTIYYLASTFGLLQGLGALAAHSSIAKVVSKDDVGKVFSFISSAEGLIYVMNAAGMAQLFNATLSLNPGLVYFGAAGLPIIPISVFIWISRLPSDEYANFEHNLQEDGNTSSLEQEQTTNINETTRLLKHL
ncbi:hypothetical protein JTE90_008224 [Oedothorax gibbosus]|uniref:Proton-coupled folate transporter n=1 Tax=Oedothorax gibbosus TaxID=931172 RepID=A0AAV6TYM3_9ARAC|nr:hypothetical protein JTE90_008224 [Oedothorax gibbosus]